MDKLFGYPSIRNIRDTTKNDQFSIWQVARSQKRNKPWSSLDWNIQVTRQQNQEEVTTQH